MTNWYAITNIVNLSRVISFGCLGPRPLYGPKYRSDVCELTDGALPLFRGTPAARLIEKVSGDDVVVLVELSGDLFPGPDDVTVTGSLIPASEIIRVHFRDEADLAAYETTPFENVDPRAIPATVSAELYRAEDGLSIAVTGAPDGEEPSLFDEGASPIEIPDPESLLRLDRRLGGLAEVIRPVTPSRSSLGLAASVLNAGLDSLAADPVLAAGLIRESEAELHVSVSEILVGTDPADRAAAGVLEKVGQNVQGHDADLTEIRRALRGRRELDGLLGETSPVLAALLLALMADSPQGVRDRGRDETEADDLVELLGLWYAGLRRGHARRPTRERIPDFEPHLQHCAARTAGGGNAARLSLPVPDVEGHARVTEAGFEYFMSAGSDIPAGTRPLPPASERLREAISSEPILVAVAQELQVPVTLTVLTSGPVKLDSSEGDVRLTISSPYELSHSVEPAAVQAALDSAEPDVLESVARSHLELPVEAP